MTRAYKDVLHGPSPLVLSLIRWCARDPRLHDVKTVLEQAVAARDGT